MDSHTETSDTRAAAGRRRCAQLFTLSLDRDLLLLVYSILQTFVNGRVREGGGGCSAAQSHFCLALPDGRRKMSDVTGLGCGCGGKEMKFDIVLPPS